MEGKELFAEFLRIAKRLNDIGIVPTLMGSLGFEQATGIAWNPQDIDIHVPGDPRGWEAPDEDRIYNFNKITQVMNGLGYMLVDLHEHEFQREAVSVEYGTVDTLPEFAGVALADLRLQRQDGVEYLLPSKSQFLAIYRASSRDSYRNEQNNNKDFLKIQYLESRAGKA
ncbi:phosphoribosylanthranilate isomerase [Leucobacter sp. OH2974_COT-288]|nr:phosphoribosylanthranilate isomerase [Leucobacter sp. OH2974_COT-288]